MEQEADDYFLSYLKVDLKKKKNIALNSWINFLKGDQRENISANIGGPHQEVRGGEQCRLPF